MHKHASPLFPLATQCLSKGNIQIMTNKTGWNSDVSCPRRHIFKHRITASAVTHNLQWLERKLLCEAIESIIRRNKILMSDNAFISFLLKSNLPQTLIESFSFRVLTDMFTKIRKTLKTVFSNVDRFHSHIFTPFHWGDPCRLVAGQVLTSGLLVWCVWDQNKVNHGFLDGLPWFTKQSGRHVFVKILSKIGRVLSNSIFEDRSSKLMFIQTFPILMGME